MLSLLYILLQDAPDGVVEGVLRVSPYDASAFGALILVLLLVIYLQYKSHQRQATIMEKLVDTLRDIELQMHSIGDLKTMIFAKLLGSSFTDTHSD